MNVIELLRRGIPGDVTAPARVQMTVEFKCAREHCSSTELSLYVVIDKGGEKVSGQPDDVS